MPKFPDPPPVATLTSKPPEITGLQPGTLLWRLYFQGGPHPTTWNGWRAYGPTRNRFDHQLPPPRIQEREILYVALSGLVCLAECFQDTRVIDRAARSPWLVAFKTKADLELLDLCGLWPTRAGASMAISSGPRPRAQRWSRTIYEAYPQIQGLYYPSSMGGNEPSAALYERAKDCVPSGPSFHRPLSDPALLPVLKKAARKIGYGLV